MTKRWSGVLNIGTLATLLWATPAVGKPTEATDSLNNCQKEVGKRVAKYVADYQKAAGKCLDRISKERIRDPLGDIGNAATTCISKFSKIVNTDKPVKTLKAKMLVKLEEACDPAVNEHEEGDVLGTGGIATGDKISAVRVRGACAVFDGDLSMNNTQEWIDCLVEGAEADALRQLHREYPQGDTWLGDLRPTIEALSLGGDARATDALVVLDGLRRFVDNGDGTVSDRLTGLMWEQKIADGTASDGCEGFREEDNTYTWSDTGQFFDGGAAAFLFYLNAGQYLGVSICPNGFGGHADWRLPTRNELVTIYDGTQGQCGGGSGACVSPIFGATGAGSYWTSTTNRATPDGARTIGYTGSLSTSLKTLSWRVRAVRGGFWVE